MIMFKPCVFIRYNPDGKESNLEYLLEVVKQYLQMDSINHLCDDVEGLVIEYLFYTERRLRRIAQKEPRKTNKGGSSRKRRRSPTPPSPNIELDS